MSGEKESESCDAEESKVKVKGTLGGSVGLVIGGEAKAKIGIVAFTAGITGEGTAKFQGWKGSADCDSGGCSNFQLEAGSVSFEAKFTASFSTFSYSVSKEW